ncbi:Retrovirus-related Pol polyprotein from transposon 17.6, partial [Sesbania bispinosa]
IAKMTMEDEELRKLMMQHTQGALPTDKFVVKDGMIFRRGRLMIPAEITLRNQIMQEFHDSKVGGHAGNTKTIAGICNQFYWPKMQEDIKTYIRNCSICQQAKVDQALPYGLLQIFLLHMVFLLFWW